MKNLESNPFLSLYVTDSPDPRVFVELFSDVLVKHAQPLFEPGNVVVRGTQGAGKSMLLNLLSPPIRLEYERANLSFPILQEFRNFVGAGINLSLSGILDIGQRPVRDHENESVLFPLLFADFLNYFVFRDLLRSLELMGTHPKEFATIVREERLDAFAIKIANEACWFGYMEGVTTFDELKRVADQRLTNYRSFHQYNCELDPKINGSKTTIGVPLSAAVDCLRDTGAIDVATPVLVRIDQIERLYRSDILRKDLGVQYRQIINKALGTRDSRVSYRIGTRQYAWDDDLVMHGTSDLLEDLRDYRTIDLDKTLRRQEDQSTWIFPGFAADVFNRRLEHSSISSPGSLEGLDLIDLVFGKSETAESSARGYIGKTQVGRALRVEKDWSDEWVRFLSKLFAEDPYDALLASAWARQSGGGKANRLSNAPPEGTPWRKSTWKSERSRQAVMQAAARGAQRLKWSGRDSVIALSAGNVSILLSICYEIWDSFLRSERRKQVEGPVNVFECGIPQNIQAVGIRSASEHWFEKIAERPGGHDRRRFVNVMGNKFRQWLNNDLAMSYPGRNGFSLTNEELDGEPEVKNFLNESVDYGDLYDAAHTTSRKDRKSRRKFYLAPIFSPFFQIPESHKKEPYYAKISEVKEWLLAAGVEVNSGQLRFPFLSDSDGT